MKLRYVESAYTLFAKHACRLIIVLVLISSVVPVLSFSCRNKNTHVQHTALFYTCSMHPQVVEAHPGKCPICGMILIAVKKNDNPDSREIKLSDQQILLGNIHVDTIRNGTIGNQTVLNATINFNQEKLTSISSRVDGRIEKLYFKNIGDYIKQGDALIQIYSEVLNNAKQEYLLLLERQKVLDTSLIDFARVIQNAKAKLLLWGMNEAQLKELENTKIATPNTTFYSTESGYITRLDNQEGDYVKEGGSIVELADLSTVWVEAQLYASHFSQTENKNMVTVTFPDIPGKEIPGKIKFVNPENSEDKRLSLLRVTIPNKTLQLKPGMFANIVLSSPGLKSLSLPADAILRGASGATVWIMSSKNTFTNKMVTTGTENNNSVEILNGLSEGELVVTSGAYLLNSEYIFRNGASPMAGMKM